MAAGLGTHSSAAATLTWDANAVHDATLGGAGAWDLNTTANWDNGTADVKWTDSSILGTDLAVFSGTGAAVTLGSNLSTLGLQFLSSGYAINAPSVVSLRIGSSGVNASAVTSGTVGLTGMNFILGQGAQNWSVGSGTTLDLGSGTITRANGTTVQFTIPTAAPSASILTTLGTASTLFQDGTNTYATVNGDWAAKDATNTKLVAGGTISGFYTATSGSSYTGSTANLDVTGSSSNLVANGSAAQSVRFSSNAARTLTINGTSAHFSTGGVLVASSTGSNLQTINNGTIQPISGNDLVFIVNNTGGLKVNSQTFGGTGNTINVVKSGSGTLFMTSITNQHRGTNFINEGILNITADTVLGQNGGAVRGQIAMNGGTLQLGADITFDTARNTTLNTNGGTFDTNTFNGVYGGTIGGIGQMTKAGTGTFTVSAANNYSGGTQVTGGTLKTDTTGKLGTGNIMVSNPGTVLELNNNLSIADTATLTLSSGTVLDMRFSSTAGNETTYEKIGVLNINGTIFNTPTIFTTGNYHGFDSYFASTNGATLQVVPEPSFLCMAGLGGTFLLKRRRGGRAKMRGVI